MPEESKDSKTTRGHCLSLRPEYFLPLALAIKMSHRTIFTTPASDCYEKSPRPHIKRTNKCLAIGVGSSGPEVYDNRTCALLPVYTINLYIFFHVTR